MVQVLAFFKIGIGGRGGRGPLGASKNYTQVSQGDVVYMYMFLYIYIYVCMHMYMYIYMYMYMYMYMYINLAHTSDYVLATIRLSLRPSSRPSVCPSVRLPIRSTGHSAVYNIGRTV